MEGAGEESTRGRRGRLIEGGKGWKGTDVACLSSFVQRKSKSSFLHVGFWLVRLSVRMRPESVYSYYRSMKSEKLSKSKRVEIADSALALDLVSFASSRLLTSESTTDSRKDSYITLSTPTPSSVPLRTRSSSPTFAISSSRIRQTSRTRRPKHSLRQSKDTCSTSTGTETV